MHVGCLAADKEDTLARLDAGMDLRGQDVADKRVAQSDEVNVNGDQQACELVERNKAGSVKQNPARAEFPLNAVRLRSGRVDPQPQGIARAGHITRIRLDE